MLGHWSCHQQHKFPGGSCLCPCAYAPIDLTFGHPWPVHYHFATLSLYIYATQDACIPDKTGRAPKWHSSRETAWESPWVHRWVSGLWDVLQPVAACCKVGPARKNITELHQQHGIFIRTVYMQGFPAKATTSINPFQFYCCVHGLNALNNMCSSVVKWV